MSGILPGFAVTWFGKFGFTPAYSSLMDVYVTGVPPTQYTVQYMSCDRSKVGGKLNPVNG